jgi:hypothetical protein
MSKIRTSEVGAIETRYVLENAGADEALEKQSATKNPFALKAVLAVPTPEGKAVGALECRDSTGLLLGVWPMHQSRMFKAISYMRAPNVPLYETTSTPMIVAGREEEVLVSFMQKLKTDPALSRTIFAQGMLAEGAVWDALQNLASHKIIRLDIIESWERSVMKREAAISADDYIATHFSKSTSKSLRRKITKLQEHGEVTLRIIDDPQEIREAFERFCQLEAAGWKGRQGTALQQHAKDAAYARAIMGNLVKTKHAFIAELVQADQAIAAGLFLRCDNEIIFLRTAYDERLSSQSPGVILDWMLTTELYHQPSFSLLDSSTDGSISPETLLWPQRRKMANAVIACGGGSVGAQAVTAAQRARLWLKRKNDGVA